MNLRSPLGKVIGSGSAKDGTEHWLAQRISAAALVLLGLWFSGSLAGLNRFSHASMTAFIAEPLNAVLLSLLCATLAYHSYLGIQVVIEDYVHREGLKVGSLIASRFAHVFVAILSIYAILQIGLGA